MIRKISHKQLHRRKIWKSYSLASKIMYYMKPFFVHLIMVWLQPLPLPTILKIVYSSCLLVFAFFPIIYPGAIFLASYWVFQYVAERDFGVAFPKNLDFQNYVHKVLNVDPSGQYRYAVFITVERFKIMTAALVSIVDYIRLALSIIV